MKLNVLLALPLLAASAAASVAPPAKLPPPAAKQAVSMPIESVKFEEVMKGISKAELWGGAKERHGSLVKFAAGAKIGLHTHSSDIRALMISGVVISMDANGKENRYGPGSYYLMPAGLKHATACAEGADCLFYEDVAGEFDLKMADEKAK